MSQKYEKLKTLLQELFQLDQPELDFGLYRIMHAKSAEVTQFLDKDLLPQVKEAFGLYKTADKAAEGKDRVFILAAPSESGRDFIGEENGELSIRFEYRPAMLTDWSEDARVGKTKPPAQKDLTALAVKRVLAVTDAALAPWIAELGRPHVKADGEKADYSRLEVHLKRYTARNTFDYFIHKDLGTFLRRELDFYIKNEVMHLDDVENETAPKVEQYLSKIKVVRKIAGKIIAFLAQLEDFQKKLWLKKKFVVETQYCITLDRIPEEFYPEIAANGAQREEWARLFAIDEIKGDLVTPGYRVPLTVTFLKAHPTLVVDTRHFDADFTARLLEAMGDVDEQTDGLLVHSENFQALSLMPQRYREQVRCIYIDPPYNTGSDGFAYKDTYQHASWMSLMADRLRLARELMTGSAGGACNLNDIEEWRMRGLIEEQFGEDAYVTTVITKCSTPSSFRTVNVGPVDVTDRITLFAKSRSSYSFTPQPVEKPVDLQHFARFITNFDDAPENWAFKPIRLQVLQDMGFDCESTQEGMRLARERWGNDAARAIVDAAAEAFALENSHRVFETKTLQKPSPWLREHIANSQQDRDRIIVVRREGGEPIVLLGGRQFYFLSKGVARIGGRLCLTEPASTLWSDIDTNNLRHEGDIEFPAGKKPLKLVQRLLKMSDHAAGSQSLDFFAGSGTTGHAVINLNREDGGRRKFILVEMGDYFDTVLLPRIKKVTFTPEWKDGKPKRLATDEEAERSPRIVKVIRLESYEDAINNLDLRRSEQQQFLLDTAEAQGADGLKEQYLLRYMLDVETRGSQSLLNVQAFKDPTAYKLKVKRPGSDESRAVNLDLLETFNWLIGLAVQHIAAPQTFTAEFERDSEKRLGLKGQLKQDTSGPWWFRTVTGTTPDGRRTLVIWRKLTGNPEQDNLVLDEWFTRQGYSTKDHEFQLTYVNGGNNLENLKAPDDTWKVRLIEEDFHRLMFDTESV